MLAGLPTDFVARKPSFWWLGYSLLEGPDGHFREHCEQMRSAIEAARKV
jgi:hypothetical protein